MQRPPSVGDPARVKPASCLESPREPPYFLSLVEHTYLLVLYEQLPSLN